jgi:hypothetical protein
MRLALGAVTLLASLTAPAALARADGNHAEEGWPAVVEQVWKHFLIERFKPYVEEGKHRKKK